MNRGVSQEEEPKPAVKGGLLEVVTFLGPKEGRKLGGGREEGKEGWPWLPLQAEAWGVNS